jgi:hypothetical protein
MPDDSKSKMPDLKKFLTDPAFQSDREFLDGYFTDFLERQEATARAKREEEAKNQPKNIFDRIFGGE